MSATPPAGWYPDPNDASSQRYWDGTAWTEHTAPVGGRAAPPAATDDGTAAAAATSWPASDRSTDWATSPQGGTSAGGTFSTWTWQSFVVTLLCGGTFVSMIGIYNAGKAEAALESGHTDQARTYARRARNWTLGGLAVGVLFITIGAVVVIATAAGIGEGGLASDCPTVTPDDAFAYAFCEGYCQDNDIDPLCEDFDP